MELWFTEDHSPNVRFSVKVDRQVYTKQSRFQRIDIFDSLEFGRIMTLDGLMMVTQKDEFIYHDMIVHVPMATNPDIKHVLLIGAGDGGAVQIGTSGQNDGFGFVVCSQLGLKTGDDPICYQELCNHSLLQI